MPVRNYADLLREINPSGNISYSIVRQRKARPKRSFQSWSHGDLTKEESMSSDSEIRDLRQRAESLALSGEWGESAIRINTRLLKIDDRAADAYTRLARCFREQGRLEAAREMYTQVLTFDSNNVIARNNLAKIEKEIGRAGELSGVSSIGSFDEAFAVGVAARKCKPDIEQRYPGEI
jgi:tetratricopeptide (TPR) repeat protein